MIVIGLDIGTTGVKSSVVSDKGEILGFAYSEYDLISECSGHYEADIELIEQSAFKVLLESSKDYKDKIEAVCVTSFGESFVLLDDENKVLRDSMIYMDTRGKKQVEEIADKLGAEKILSVTGLAPNEMYSVAKLNWIKDNENGKFLKTKKIHFIADFILSRLGGGHYTDYSLASRSMMFDVVRHKWWDKALNEVGLDESILPEPVATGSKVGELNAEAEKHTGLKKGIPLIIGGHDQIANAVGAGLLEAGQAMNGIGTVDCITVAFDPNKGKKILESDVYPFVPYIDGKAYVTYAVSFSGGSILKWFRDTFARELPSESAYEILNKEAPREPTQLTIVPHFAGSGTPYIDTSVKACIDGLDLTVDRGTIFRGLMEAETMSMRLDLELLEKDGVHIDSIRTVGGGAKSELWMQIRADIFNKVVISMDIEQAGALGSAMFALVYKGVYKDLFEARDELLKERKRFYPNKENVEKYDIKYREYLDAIEKRRG